MNEIVSSVYQQLSVSALTVVRVVFNYRILLFAAVLTVVLRLLYAVYRLFQTKWRGERELSQFPCQDRHWLYGHLHILTNSEASIGTLVERSAGNSPAAVRWLGPFISRVVFNHPLTIKALLSTTEPKDDLFYGMLKPWLGDGLLISSGQKWFRNRRLLTPGFHFDILKPYVKVYNECVQTMLAKWSGFCHDHGEQNNGCDIEIFEQISLMTLDSLLKCIFSQESNCQRDKNKNPYIRGVYDLSYLIPARTRFVPYHNDVIFHMSRMGYKFRRALRTVHEYSKRVIRERRNVLKYEDEKTAQQKRKYIDFLDILLRAKDEESLGLCDQEIQDEVDTFMFEGHDTTASGISWCLYNMAMNPEHQQKCREEIDDLMAGKLNTEIEWDDLHKLSYTTMCIKESLRTHPPVPIVARQLKSPLLLHDGRVVPSGHTVIASIIAMHYNSNVWPDPSKYDPLRFLPDNCIDRSPYAFLPFSAGPRNCIGQNFAMNEMKIAIAAILNRFELFPVKDKVPKRTNNVVLRSSNGIHLQIRPRTLSTFKK
ncbi:leukotriene-B4 omega-hydroxylase 3-like [Ptychodera flava]|uniref:leukotriene-B4 omega-hydroxylase 3-like n=1 Tax=Ptychodera flava TaxID=63121 RepID=UPI00396A6294